LNSDSDENSVIKNRKYVKKKSFELELGCAATCGAARGVEWVAP